MDSPAADLAATRAAGLAALLVEDLARGLEALGAGLAGGLVVGSMQPLWQAAPQKVGNISERSKQTTPACCSRMQNHGVIIHTHRHTHTHTHTQLKH